MQLNNAVVFAVGVTMKRFLITVLVTALAVSAVYYLWNRKPPPERALCKMLDALQDGDIWKAERYIQNGDLGFVHRNRRTKKFYKAMFSTISYTVTDLQVEDDEAIVTVSITMVDMDTVLSGTSAALLSHNLRTGWSVRNAFYDELTEVILSGDADTVTKKSSARVVRTGGRWRVILEEGGLPSAITGGNSDLIGY